MFRAGALCAGDSSRPNPLVGGYLLKYSGGGPRAGGGWLGSPPDRV